MEIKTASGLEDLLGDINEAHGGTDSYLLCLGGLVCQAMGKEELASEYLCKAVLANPWNWAAWRAFRFERFEDYEVICKRLPESPLKPFFQLKSFLWLHIDVTDLLQILLSRYPRLTYLRFAQAQNAFNCRQFEKAVELFAECYRDDEDTLELAHLYADALFVLGRKAELAHLAGRCVQLNRFCPETCCVLGNLWSLQGEHERAAISFRRALRLDPRLPSAWVLVGHEFVELHNPSAAISAYLRATKVNPNDYRAWYGLGQVYDLLASPAQAAEFYRRAADLQPGDGRFWAALGRVYEREELWEHAHDAYRNALECSGSVELMVWPRLGAVLLELGDEEAALDAFRQFLGPETGYTRQPIDGAERALGLLHIAKHYISVHSKREDGIALLVHLSSGYSGVEGREAKRLLESINNDF